MAVITKRGLSRHMGERVRVGNHHTFLSRDEKGFYLRAGDDVAYRIKHGDEISIHTSHPWTPIMSYDVDLEG